MSDRRGFSLVEMIVVLVLAGIVSTAAITMFSTQNRLNSRMTALGESQENARSAVQLVASDLRAATDGAVLEADADRVTVRIPIVIGVVCGEQNSQFKGVYFPLGGEPVDEDAVDGFAVRDDDGVWQEGGRLQGANRFSENSRDLCIDAGAGAAGEDSDYATLRVADDTGTPVMLYREVSYYFAPSLLDDSRRGFYRSQGGDAIELAGGFSDDTRFEYQLDGETTWLTDANGASTLERIEAVRLAVEVSGEGAPGALVTFSLTRDIRLRNAR